MVMIIAYYKIRKMPVIVTRSPSRVCEAAMGPSLVAASPVTVARVQRDVGQSFASAWWHWACSSGLGTRFSQVSVPVLAGLLVPWGQRRSWMGTAVCEACHGRESHQ